MYSGPLSKRMVLGFPRHLIFNDVGQAADDPLCRKGEIHLDAQTFAVEVIQHVQQTEGPTALKPIGHDVHRPGHMRPLWHSQSVRHIPLQALRGLIRRFSSRAQ